VPKALHGGVWRHAHTLFNEGVLAALADEELLDRFVTAHAEARELAFEALVDRHGKMVLRICRAVLRDKHDAEDAFQATFLVLARQAAAIRTRASLASYLHGVARRVASCARSAASRRREHERKAADLGRNRVAEPHWDDMAQVLHEEIDRLPEQYRAPILLCDMEGLTEGQAATRLGRPIGTIRSQRARGRQRLRCQLTRRGLAPASAALVLTTEGFSASVIVPPALVSATIESAMRFAVARATEAGVLCSSAAVLAEEFLGSVLMARIRNAAMAALVAIGIATAGAFALGAHGEKPHSAGDSRHELLDLARAWAKALVQSDVGTMDRLMAYEMFGTDPVGGLWDKAKYLERVKTNAFHFESCEFKESRVQVYGDAAVVAGLFMTNFSSKGSPQRVERSTSTWIRRHGSWQCVAWQSMFVPVSDPHSDAKPAASVPALNPRPDGALQRVPELVPFTPYAAPRQ
jgi:RNA polymerase sigma factor (sigma-70 family)